tara:strand:+ start:417 stop:1127 length:711 start_codon:yes stop_codon:yes gene_type:complete
VSLKNWDNRNWLSSKKYILSFNEFLIKFNNLHPNSRILDIGCGRGKISGSLSSKLRLNSKPIGIDIINHKDKDRRINFKKIDALSFLSKNKIKFDLILIKQTLHLLKFNQIKILLKQLKKHLNVDGKIFILTLNPHKNELPNFELMKKKLSKALLRDKKILSYILKLYPKSILKKFSYKVKINKDKYKDMIAKKYISILLKMSKKQILLGIKEINLKYKRNIKFNDKLICIIIKNK